MQPIVFPSKVDGWLGIALIIAALMSVGMVLMVGVMASPMSGLVLSPILLISAGLPIWLLRSTHYTVESADLHVQSGPFEWRVPISEIRAVTPTRNPLSSPALSLDRLRIDYGRDASIMVSPRNKAQFLTVLEDRRRAG